MIKVMAACVLVTGALIAVTLRTSSSPPAAGATDRASRSRFVETFDGTPGHPTPWNPDNWDVTVHTRDNPELPALETMKAQHAMDCAGPPATHTIDEYADAVFNCKDHVMTSIKAEGYGVIYLTPDQMVDFGSSATISVDVSTRRSSIRDWWDIWITPYGEQLQAPLEETYPDLDGPPKDAVHIYMSDFDGGTVFKASIYEDFTERPIDADWSETYDSYFTPDAARRDTFTLDLSPTHLTFGMPADAKDGIPSAPITWIDTKIPKLDWTQGVVQFGHHSYNPEKDAGCGDICEPNTWHWDNVSIDPAIPFAIDRATTRAVVGPNPGRMKLRAPAPADGFLRFMAIGNRIEVSFDGGKSWKAAKKQEQMRSAEEHASNYWMPIPAGTTDVMFRGEEWFAGDWVARDVSVFADNGTPTPVTTSPASTIPKTTTAPTSTPSSRPPKHAVFI